MLKSIKFLTTVLAILAIATVSPAEIVDPNGPRNEVLGRLAGNLDAQGVDVRFGSNAGTASPSRPQLTPLASFQSSVPVNFGGSRFAMLFARGIAFESALFAVDTRSGDPFSDPREFKQRWAGVPSDRRVFVSFASTDAVVARQVASALNASGYSTFIYIGRDAAGVFNAVDTGNYFREAGHRFVVDTKSSRGSTAVAAEAMFARDPNRISGGGQIRGGASVDSEFGCCKVCTYRNGILMSCGAIICGDQCRDARR